MTKILLGESVMQQDKCCPRCKHGRHKEHVVDFMSRTGQVTLCRCSVCAPIKPLRPSAKELEAAQ